MSALPPNAIDLDDVTDVRVGTTQIAEIRAGAVKIWPGGPANYREAVLADSPRAYYRLGEASGNAIDEMGGTQGAPSGALTRAQPSLLPNGDGASTGFGGGWIAVAFNAAMNIGASAFTLECWFREDAISQTTNRGVIRSGWNLSDSFFGLTLRTVAGTANGPADGITLSAGGSSTNPNPSGFSAARQTTHHLAVVRSTPNVAYLNGQPYDFTFAGGTTNGSNFFIGAQPPTSLPFAGRIQEVALYNYALTQQQIETHFRVAGGRP